MSAGVPPSPQGRSSRRTASEHLHHPRPVLPGLVFSEDGLPIEAGALGSEARGPVRIRGPNRLRARRR